MLKDFELIIEALATQGWVVFPQFMSASQVEACRQQALTYHADGRFTPASIGRGASQTINSQVRQDAIFWLNDSEQGMAGEFQAWTHALIQALNETLYLGLVEAELHFALYPEGGFYQRHIDNFKASSARLITVILYLNQHWTQDQGGELRIYLENEQVMDIAPQAGTLVIFLSERFEHEVLPTQQERLSLTGWLRRRSSLV